jgi:sarcosine oxidase delta subunit
MTDKVTKPLGRLDPDKVPAVCPICAQRMEMPFGAKLAAHLRAKHPDKIGRAKPYDERSHGSPPWREFAHIRSGGPGWAYIIWLDFAYSVDHVDLAQYRVEWAEDGRNVPVNPEGESR